MGKTRLSNDLTKPSPVEPGDAPYDTTDPTEFATTAMPDKAAAAKAGYGAVNAVVPLPQQERPQRDTKNDRYEMYELIGPNGKPVKVTRNVETGETKTGGSQSGPGSASSSQSENK